MVFRVFLTGGDAGRRTSLLIRALSDLRVISGGWVKLTLSGGAERVPGLVEPREAAAAELPLAAFEDSRYSPEALLSRAAAALDEGAAREMCWLDPLLGDELADGAIAARIEELLGLELPVIGSVAAREECPNPGLYDRILSRLGADEGTLLLDADAAGRRRACRAAARVGRKHPRLGPSQEIRPPDEAARPAQEEHFPGVRRGHVYL